MILDMTFETREKLIKKDSYDDGVSEGIASVALNMLIKNAPLSDIISYTGLNEDQIIAIANNNGIKLEE